MKLGRIILLAVVAALVLVSSGWAQNAGGPVFADNPKPQSDPQFIPPEKQGKSIIYPFQEYQQKVADKFMPVTYPFDNPAVADADAHPGFFLFMGLSALRRNEFHRGDVATVSQPFGFDPSQLDYQSVGMNFNFGFRGAIDIFLGDDSALELSGFYLFNTSSSHTASGNSAPDPSWVSIPFTHAPANFNPLAYQRDFINDVGGADSVKINYSLSMADVELNYRYPLVRGVVDLLLGIRFLDLNEKIALQADSLSLGVTTYSFNVRDRIIGPQVGVDIEELLMPKIGLNFTAKAAVGPNFAQIVHTFTQNDSQGLGSDSNHVLASGIFELGVFTNIWFNERFRLHVGYETMWVVHLPDAQAQINFNTSLPNGTQNFNGSFFFQGPVFEFQLAF